MKNIFFAVYDADDNIIGVYESYEEMSDRLSVSKAVLRCSLHRHEKLRICGKWARIYRFDERESLNI